MPAPRVLVRTHLFNSIESIRRPHHLVPYSVAHSRALVSAFLAEIKDEGTLMIPPLSSLTATAKVAFPPEKAATTLALYHPRGGLPHCSIKNSQLRTKKPPNSNSKKLFVNPPRRQTKHYYKKLIYNCLYLFTR